MAESLWPEDIARATITTPIAILKEQAAILSDRTKNAVVAEVTSDGAEDGIVVRFILFAPSLNYRVKLFDLYQSIEIYPLTAYVGDEGTRINNENSLKEWLRTVLASDRAKRIVQGLVAQATA